MKAPRHRSRPRRADRRGFTLIEVIIASVITAFLLGTVSMSLVNLGRTKDSSKRRFAAFMRADNALNAIRRDVASTTRASDLFHSRILLTSSTYRTEEGQEYPRSELLLFCTQLQNIREINYTGEGLEYETQYRVIEDENGPVLWRRRDALPDVYPDAGGVATPIVEGVLGMRIQAFDGLDWRDEWDSDYDGLPLGLRMTLWTSGHRELESAYERQPLELMSTIAIDRVEPPFDHKLLALDALFAELEAERAEEQAVEAAGAADEVDRALNDGAGGSRSRAVRPDGQRRPTGRQRGNTRQPNSRGGSGAADTIREGPPS